jgi:hypothetical protein
MVTACHDNEQLCKAPHIPHKGTKAQIHKSKTGNQAHTQNFSFGGGLTLKLSIINV